MNLMISVINLSDVLLNLLTHHRKMMNDLNSSEKLQIPTTEQVLENLLERIELLEAKVESLKHPQLMYKRPNGKYYEKVTDFLDDVDGRLLTMENGK